jgi:hypothetical protein
MSYAAEVLRPSEKAPSLRRTTEPGPTIPRRRLLPEGAPRQRPRVIERDPQRYLLCLRFALLNLVGFSLLAAAHAHGLVEPIVSADRTRLSVIIFAVFLAGLGLCAIKVWHTSRDLNDARQSSGDTVPRLARIGSSAESRANLAGALRLRLMHRIVAVRHIANTLVLLGLIGTVIGFIIALSGVDPGHASEVTAIAPMVAALIQGMSTALYTTLVGAVLNLWLMANYQLLAGGVVKLIASVVEAAESHARARAT